MTAPALSSIDALVLALQGVGYFADRRLATAVFLALKLQRPLLLEGEPGVGKTALAQALSKVLERSLIRLQCYDGLEQREALYEWNYAAQLLHMRAAEMLTPTLRTDVSSLPPEGALAALGRPGGGSVAPTATAARDIEAEVYQDRYLIRRPLLQALQAPAPGAVLLIDEVDRADEPFEAFLLEYLGEYQVSIPEIGTVRATATPVTILTSNRTRDLHDAVKRRCLYHWLEHPGIARELAIVRSRAPEVPEALADQVVRLVHGIRTDRELLKPPGVAETLDWARALNELGTRELDTATAAATLGVAVKYREDAERVRRALDIMLTT